MGRKTQNKAFLYLAGSLLQGLGLLLIQPFAVRILPSEEWGLVSTSVVTVQVVVVLLSSGLPLEITRLWFDPSDGRARARAMHTVLSAATLVIGAILVMVTLGVGGTSSGVASLTAAMVCIGVTGSILGAQALLRAQSRPVAFVLLSVGSSVIANAAGLAAILLWARSASFYMTAYAVAVAGTAVCAQMLARPVGLRSALSMGSHALRIALPLLPHTGALMLLTQGAVWLLAVSASITDAGRYGTVLIFALGPVTVLNALNNAWATDMMGAVREYQRASLRAAMRAATAVGLLVALLASSAGLLGAYVLSTDPEVAGKIAQALPTLSVGYGLFLIASNQLYIDGRTRILGIVSPLVSVAAAIVALPFATMRNLVAIAWVHALGFLVLGVLVAWAALARSSARYVIGALLLTVFSAVAALILTMLPGSLPTAVVECVAGLLSVVLMALILRRALQRSTPDQPTHIP